MFRKNTIRVVDCYFLDLGSQYFPIPKDEIRTICNYGIVSLKLYTENCTESFLHSMIFLNCTLQKKNFDGHLQHLHTYTTHSVMIEVHQCKFYI